MPRRGDAAAVSFEPNAYIRIEANGAVTLWITRSEMGQGVRTNLAATLADELDVDLSRVTLQQAMPGSRFTGIRLRTSGSGSSSATFLALRRAAAAAREMLVAAAASRWSVSPGSCHSELGRVTHRASGRDLSYGELVEAAGAQPVPQKPQLKSPAEWRYIAKPIRRIDARQIAMGAAVYGLDARPANALVAVIQRCPHLDGKLRRFDATRIPGVSHVVPVTSGIFPGVAVVADTTWTAMKGCDALTVEWERGPQSSFDSTRHMEALLAATAQDGYPIRRDGDVPASLALAETHLEAVYEYPFQAHAPVEPMNCAADVKPDRCEVWASTQAPETAYQNAIQKLGLPADAVQVNTTLSGGGFGRRLFVDYVDEAVELSQAIGKPVQVVWRREDDMRNGFFHPASVEKLSAALGGGKIAAWQHKSVGSDLSMFGLPTAQEKRDPQHYAKNEDPWGAYDTPYNFAALQVDYVPVDSPVPTGAWRAVEYPSRVFARESFLDEVAHAFGHDPLQIRIDLLQPGDVLTLGSQKIDRARMIRVLETARAQFAWKQPFAVPGRLAGKGLALNIYDADSYMIQIAEVSSSLTGSDLKIHRILCAFDCGLAINPAGLEGQVESGITWGLSATLHGKIDFRNGVAQQTGYHDFQVMRMNEMPAIETLIVPSDARPGGFGEHPVAPVAPAVANAIFAATGRRLRKLPLSLA
jgi:isoquinoline 1-oxidoreductase beta subunit